MTSTTSLTRKGQITIPKKVREALGLKPFDRIELRVENGEVRLRKVRPTLKDIAGVLPGLGIPIEDMPTIAKEERAERYRQRER
jgi:AbrB family looped-hinge helix DNA binding protein